MKFARKEGGAFNLRKAISALTAIVLAISVSWPSGLARADVMGVTSGNGISARADGEKAQNNVEENKSIEADEHETGLSLGLSAKLKVLIEADDAPEEAIATIAVEAVSGDDDFAPVEAEVSCNVETVVAESPALKEGAIYSLSVVRAPKTSDGADYKGGEPYAVSIAEGLATNKDAWAEPVKHVESPGEKERIDASVSTTLPVYEGQEIAMDVTVAFVLSAPAQETGSDTGIGEGECETTSGVETPDAPSFEQGEEVESDTEEKPQSGATEDGDDDPSDLLGKDELEAALAARIAAYTKAVSPRSSSVTHVGWEDSFTADGWTQKTNYMEIDGQFAMCCTHFRETPPVGTPASVIGTVTNEDMRKVAWYGWGGPGDLGYSLVHTACMMSNANGDTPVMSVAGMLATVVSKPSPPSSFVLTKWSTGGWTQDMITWTYHPNGHLYFQKSSSDPTITDGNDCYSLAGSVYDLFKADGAFVRTITTPSSGYVDLGEIEAGRYYFVEQTAPKGFKLDKTPVYVTVPEGGSVTAEAFDRPHTDPIYALLHKYDAETGGKVQGDAKLIAGEFTVKFYAGSYPSGIDPATLGKSSTRSWIMATDQDGFCYFDAAYVISGDPFYLSPATGKPSFPIGTVTVQETKAPKGYLLSTPELPNKVVVQRITQEGIEGSSNESWNEHEFLDKVVRGGVEISKIDAETGAGQPQGGAAFAGAKVAIKNRSANAVLVDGTSYGNGEIVKTLTLDAAGKASTSADALPAGHYSYYESAKPDGYLVDPVERTFDIVENGKIVVLDGAASVHDEVIRGGVEICKVDAGTGLGQPQGAAVFAGAKVAIKTQNANAVMVEGKSYSKGTTVKTLTLDAAGKAKTAVDLLPYGRYSYIETAAPEGYLIDSTERYFDIADDGMIVVLDGAAAVCDVVKAGDVSLTKFAQPAVSGGNPDVKDPLPNVKFDVVNDSANPVQRKDGTLAKKGEAVDTVTTDARGYAETTDGTLAYGKYHLHERPETVPPGYATTADIPFEIYADKQKLYYIIEDPTGTPVKLLKVDAETGERIAGKMTFRVLDEDKKPVRFTVTYPTYTQVTDLTTDDAGSCMLPEKLNGGKQYYLEEVTAPEGYTLNGELVPFKIDGTAGWTWDNPLVITMSDMPQKGVIGATKVDAETGLPVAVPGIGFEVSAIDDVVTPDGTVRAHAGDVVSELVTGADGTAITPELYLGAYEVAETHAPDGYVLNPEPVEVVLEYAGQSVQVVREGATIADKPQKGTIKVSKIDAETGAIVAARGIGFDVVAPKDVVTPDGTVRAHAGDVVAELVTSDDGTAETDELYLGRYLVCERFAPDGYVLNPEPVEVVLAYAGQEVEVVREGATLADAPQKGTITIVKADAADGRPVPGAEYEVKASSDIVTPDGTLRATAGDLVAAIVTGEDGRAVTDELYLGGYDVRETYSPDGWALDGEVHHVELEYAGQEVDVVRAALDTTDAPTVFRLQKSAQQPDGELVNYEGSEWRVWAVDGSGTTVFDVEVATDADGGFALERIPHGDGYTYYCQETKTGDDYILDAEVYEFAVDEDGMIDGEPTYTLDNVNYHKRTIVAHKQDADTGGPVSNTLFALEHWSGLGKPVDAGGDDADGEWVEVSRVESDAAGDALFEELGWGWYHLVELYQNPDYMAPGENGLAGEFWLECSPASGIAQIQVVEDKPLTVETRVSKSTISQTSAGLVYKDDQGNTVTNVGEEQYRYDVSFDSGKTNVFADEYWVRDECQMTASPYDMRIESIVTPVVSGDTDGRVHVLVKTNKGGDSAAGMSFAQPELHPNDTLCDGSQRFDPSGYDYLGEYDAASPSMIDVSDILEPGEHITGIVLCYGAVEAGFAATSPMSYMVSASHELEEGTIIPNAVTSHIARNWSSVRHTAEGDVEKEPSGPHDDAADGVLTTVISTFDTSFGRDLSRWGSGRLISTGDPVGLYASGIVAIAIAAAVVAIIVGRRKDSRGKRR